MKSENSIKLLDYSIKVEINTSNFEDELQIALINFQKKKNNQAFYKMVSLSCMLIIISISILIYPQYLEIKKAKNNKINTKYEINQNKQL